MKKIGALAFALLLALSMVESLRAEVIDSTANGFKVRQVILVSATPEKLYKSLLSIDQWWSSEHTYSQNAANLHLDAKPGGCWCEKLPSGGVQHMTVVYIMPNRRVVLSGGLGPLQTLGTSGAMLWQLTPKGAQTELVVEYTVGGYMQGGLAAIAAPVDGVLGIQFERLKRLVETGSAEEKKPVA